MAKVHFGAGGVTGWSGKTGHSVFRIVNGQTVVQQAPMQRKRRYRKPRTEKQKAWDKITSRAGKYGSRALKNPELRAIYTAIAASENKPLISMANRDAFRAPVVEEIDASAYSGAPGDVIAVAASDDTGVVQVDVALADADGAVFESGEAELDASGWWLYAAQSAVEEGSTVRVVARAVDRPDREGFGWIDTKVRHGVSRARRRRRRHIPGGGSHPALQEDRASLAAAHSPSPRGTSADSRSSGDGVSANSLSVRTEVSANSLSLDASALLDPAQLLKDARALAGLSQRELARQAGRTPSVIGRIERGESSPTVETLLGLLRSAGFEVAVALVTCSTT